MTLTIYGSAESRTQRVLWLATELALEFEHVEYEWDDPALKSEHFRHLNPAGAIPTIVDDGFALSESLAINLYLAKRYGQSADDALCAHSVHEEAKMLQWSLWAQAHLEPWVQTDGSLADPVATFDERCGAVIAASLETLERGLADDSWLVGSRFTVADLNVAGVLSPSRSRTLDLRRYPRVSDWLRRCYSRPAAVAARRAYQRRSP